MMIDDAPLF